MSLAIVARRYAQALLELGVQNGELEKLVGEFETVAAAWNTSADLRDAVENPLVAHPVKKAVISELADQIGASTTSRHALLLLVDRHRMRALPYIARALHDLADERAGVLRAEVTTAAPLSDDYYQRLQTQLERMTGKRVVVDHRTDPSIVAGVVTRIGDRVLDGSLRSRLESLRDALLPTA